jgi:hypothetical protein
VAGFVTDVGTMYATFTDPEGVTWQLTDTTNDSAWFTSFGVAGWAARPYEFVTDPLPRGGESVRFIRAQAARLTWPMHIWGSTHVEFVQRYRELRRAIMMTVHRRLPGTLRVARGDGTAREIDCYYEEGFAGEPGEHWLFANPVLTLYCPDGYWRDVEPVTVEHSYSGVIVPYLDPFPTVSSSQVLGITTVNNAGEVDAWPEWTITGPMTSLNATNHTTGQEFTLTYTLTAGQQITITSLRPTVRGPGDINLIGSLDWPASYLWPLSAGVNDVEFDVAGAAAGSAIALTFYPRYEGA